MWRLPRSAEVALLLLLLALSSQSLSGAGLMGVGWGELDGVDRVYLALIICIVLVLHLDLSLVTLSLSSLSLDSVTSPSVAGATLLPCVLAPCFMACDTWVCVSRPWTTSP